MVEFNLAKVIVEGSNPFFCCTFMKMNPKAVFGISFLLYNTGITLESTFLFVIID